jgi:hypothetical protein
MSRAGQDYLVTNWHVVAGRNCRTGNALNKFGAVPKEIVVMQRGIADIDPSAWHFPPIVGARVLPLLDAEEQPLWLEDPEFGRIVDVVALPLEPDPAFRRQPHVFSPWADNLLVTDELSIVGFPFGKRVGKWQAIWSRATVATDPDLPYEDLPCFLVDSRTRVGQSGSPALRPNPRDRSDRGPAVDLVGVYSGRISDESDLGFVWTVSALREILHHGIPGDGGFEPNDPSHLWANHE